MESVLLCDGDHWNKLEFGTVPFLLLFSHLTIQAELMGVYFFSFQNCLVYNIVLTCPDEHRKSQHVCVVTEVCSRLLDSVSKFSVSDHAKKDILLECYSHCFDNLMIQRWVYFKVFKECISYTVSQSHAEISASSNDCAA